MGEEGKQYSRDKRSPKPKSEGVSRVMSGNKAKDTKPELALRKALWAAGLRGYRTNYKGVPGRPDIAYVGKRLAVFVNGCFWHRCPHCNYALPKNNTAFWEEKFGKNKARDAKKTALLEEQGWTVLTVWECELKDDISEVVGRVRAALG